MTRPPRRPPSHLLAPPAPASEPPAGTSPPASSPDAPAESPKQETSADSVEPGPELILAFADPEIARAAAEAKCWVVYRTAGSGEVTVRIVADPNLPTDPDATWIETQLVLGLGLPANSIQESTLIWSDPDAERT